MKTKYNCEDYISRDYLLNEYDRQHKGPPGGARKIIVEAPAADVVEVVRCRECYFRALDGADVPVCTGAMAYSYTPDDWFCAAGKPKDGGQDDGT